MSEDLDNKDVKVKPGKKTTTRKTTKKTTQKIDETPKVESLNAVYKYDAKDGEQLIVDKPSIPLIKVEPQEVKPEEVKEVKEVKPEEVKPKNNNIQMQKPSIPKTNGEIYEAYIRELKNFKLVYNGDVIFDSTLSKNNSTLKFEADYFVLFGKKYSYNGLRIQKI